MYIHNPYSFTNILQTRVQNSIKHVKWSLFVKIAEGQNSPKVWLFDWIRNKPLRWGSNRYQNQLK